MFYSPCFVLKSQLLKTNNSGPRSWNAALPPSFQRAPGPWHMGGGRKGNWGVHSINMYLGDLLCLEGTPKACCLACPSTLLPAANASTRKAWPPPLTGFLVGNPQEFPLSIQVSFPLFLAPTTSLSTFLPLWFLCCPPISFLGPIFLPSVKS